MTALVYYTYLSDTFTIIFFSQMDTTTTVFFGGFNDPNIILTFSWITMTYTVKNSRLIKSRIYSACAPLTRDGKVIDEGLFT